MADIDQACRDLSSLVESEKHEDWPVLHVPLHANTFPLAYVYSCLLLIRANQLPAGVSAPTWASSVSAIPATPEDIKKLPLINKLKVPEEWSDKPPRLEPSARFNIFFANKTQITRWERLLTFQPFLFFNYEHKFFLVEDSTSPASYNSVSDWIKALPNTLKKIRIVTDIEAEVGALRNELYTAFAKGNKTPPSEGIQVVRSNERSPYDVFQWTFADGPSKEIARVLFFGTPLCETLKSKSNYRAITCAFEPVPTYLCIHASDPAEAYCPVWPIYKFFTQLGYPNNGSRSGLADLTEIATGFRRCMETRLPIEEPNFPAQFKESISNHCILVDKADLFK